MPDSNIPPIIAPESSSRADFAAAADSVKAQDCLRSFEPLAIAAQQILALNTLASMIERSRRNLEELHMHYRQFCERMTKVPIRFQADQNPRGIESQRWRISDGNDNYTLRVDTDGGGIVMLHSTPPRIYDYSHGGDWEMPKDIAAAKRLLGSITGIRSDQMSILP